jgi:hypothetical protein
MDGLPQVTSEEEAAAILRELAVEYGIPEDRLRCVALWIGARVLFESEVLLAQVRLFDAPRKQRDRLP